MKPISEVTACVIDNSKSGNYLPVARGVSGDKGYGRVLYHNPNWQQASPIFNEACIGDGFPNVEWCEDFWTIKNEIDLWLFPDIGRTGLQAELIDQGRLVWGAGPSTMLETHREFFLKMLKDLGLDLPEFDKVVGISALREYLKDKENIYIKMSKWRGSWETKHFRNWKLDGHKLDFWAVKFGGAREYMKFLCFPEIKTLLEIGADTVNVRGQWPERLLHGLEKKDAAYLSAVTQFNKMPEQITRILDAFSPWLAKQRAATAWSMEVRVTEQEAFFLDATMRGGLPSTGSQILAMRNLPAVIYHGAQGELIQPDYEFLFTAECMVNIKGDPGCWETLIFDAELEEHMLCSDCCMIDGQVWWPYDDKPIVEIGWLVARGNTPTEVAEEMNRLADLLPDGADADVESLADIIREVEEEEKQGIKFTDQPLPDPEIVLEPST